MIVINRIYYNRVTADQIQPALSKIIIWYCKILLKIWKQYETTETSVFDVELRRNERYSVTSKRSNDAFVAYELRNFKS